MNNEFYDQWMDIFSSLPDNIFFELVRHYLGPLKTPFHKPEIVAKMAVFLNREDVIQNTISYIDVMDAQILSCIDIHNVPTDKNLGDILKSYSPLALRERIHNLMERLLIWKQSVFSIPIYKLTPLGQRLHDAGVIGPGVILGSSPINIDTGILPVISDNILNSALSFLFESPRIFLKQGSWRKKTITMLKEHFPSFFQATRSRESIMIMGQGLLNAGLAYLDGEKFELNIDAWKDFERLTGSHRHLVMVVCALMERHMTFDQTMKIVVNLTEGLPANNAYSRDNLVQLVQLVYGGQYTLSERKAGRILDKLVHLGELIPDRSGHLVRVQMNKEQGGQRLSVSPVGEITCFPDCPLSVDLALSTLHVHSDVFSIYKIEKNRFFKAMEFGVTVEKLCRCLEKLSGQQVPQNIVALLTEWKVEYNSLFMRLAIVLKASGMNQKMIETTKVLDPFVLDKPADDTWILDYKNQTQWKQALSNAGISTIPTIEGFDEKMHASNSDINSEHTIVTRIWNTPKLQAIDMGPTVPLKDFDKILQDFSSHPSAQNLDGCEKDVFLERLYRRLILTPLQIRSGIWRQEVMQAKGLDYHGKVRLAEAALIGRNERLEIVQVDGMDLIKVTIIPLRIEKTGHGHRLVGIRVPEETQESFDIRKISLLKRVKISML